MTRRTFLVGLFASGCGAGGRVAAVDPASYAPAASPAERARLNKVGEVEGYGWCLHCGDRWNWKPRHTIVYGAGRGIFPLCEYDYWRLPVERVEAYIRQLVREWEASSPGERVALADEERLAIAAMRAERRRSGRGNGRQDGPSPSVREPRPGRN